MTIAADQAAALAALQRTGLHGGTLTHTEHAALLRVVRAAATTGAGAMATCDVYVQQALSDSTTTNVSVTTTAGIVAAEFDILDAFTGSSTAADIVAAIATSSTNCRATALATNALSITSQLAVVAAGIYSTAALAANGGGAVLPANDVIDGTW